MAAGLDQPTILEALCRAEHGDEWVTWTPLDPPEQAVGPARAGAPPSAAVRSPTCEELSMITAPTAEELDRADPLGPLPPPLRRRRGRGVGLPGRQLARTAGDLDRRASSPSSSPDHGAVRLIRCWDEAWMDEPTRVGDRLGEVVLGAAAGQVIVADSTSVLIYKLVRAAVDADPGRTEIVIDRQNFPTDRFLLQGVAAERGLTIRWLDVDPAAGVREQDLEPALGDRTAVVVLSHVAYRSGFLADAAGDHRPGAPRRRPDDVGSEPLGRLRADRPRRLGRRPGGRLHVQVPQRRAGLPRLLLRPARPAGPPAAADLGLDGGREPLRDGPRLHARRPASGGSPPGRRRSCPCNR